MAGQNQKRTRSKRGMHRSHHSIKNFSIAMDQTTGEVHLSHHMTKDGFYKGIRIKPEKIKQQEEDQEQNKELTNKS